MFTRNRDKSNANDAGNRDSMSVTSKTQTGGNLTKTLSKATMLLTGSGRFLHPFHNLSYP